MNFTRRCTTVGLTSKRQKSNGFCSKYNVPHLSSDYVDNTRIPCPVGYLIDFLNESLAQGHCAPVTCQI